MAVEELLPAPDAAYAAIVTVVNALGSVVVVEFAFRTKVMRKLGLASRAFFIQVAYIRVGLNVSTLETSQAVYGLPIDFMIIPMLFIMAKSTSEELVAARRG